MEDQIFENVIVGSGPSGILISSLLIGQSKRVLLIEAGDFDRESILLNKRSYNFVTPSKMPEGIHTVGGGSTQWYGRVGEFYDSDYLGHVNRIQRWIIDKKEMNQYFKQLYKLLLNDERLDTEFIKSEKVLLEFKNQIRPPFDLRLFRFSHLQTFNKLLEKLFSEPKFELRTRLICKEIVGNNSGGYTLKLNDELGNNVEIVARRVIIAGGTLQSTALLLRSETLNIPARKKYLGKYLMEHFDGFVGELVVGKKDSKFLAEICQNSQHRFADKEFGMSFSLSHDQILKLGYPNLHFEVKHYQKNFVFEPWLLGGRIPNLIRKPLFFAERVFKFIIDHWKRSFDKLKKQKRFNVWMKGEEFPYSQSTLRLSEYVDNLFVRRLDYNHRISDVTSNKVREELKYVKLCLEKNQLGRFKPYKHLMFKFIKFYLKPNWHPMGTSVMGTDPSLSICDINLELHGNKNIHLLNAGVFPTGSNQNPTAMVLALAYRLSKYIENQN